MKKPIVLAVAPGLIAGAFLVAVPQQTDAQQTDRIRVAVVDMENNSAWRAWGGQLGGAAADQLANELVRSDRFSVIERERLQAVLQEQDLGVSGRVNPATAAQIGELLGVQVLVTGSVNQFSLDRTRAGVGRVAATVTRAEAVLDVRMIDTSTGEILLAAEGSGSRRLGGAVVDDIDFERTFDAGVAEEALRPAIEDAVQSIVSQSSALEGLRAVAATATVVGAGDAGVYLDRGQNFGIEVGQRFDVYRVVDEIRDAHGNLLDVVTVQVGVVEVTQVLSQSAITRVVEGEAAEGDEARPEG